MSKLKSSSTNLLAGSQIAAGSVPGWTDQQNNVGRQLMMIYMSGGWSKAGSAGMIGNQFQESGLNPSEAGGYLSQWGGARLANLVTFANALGQPVTSVEAQAKFVLNEMKTGYGQLDSYLQTTKDPSQAAVLISNQYERPLASAANNANRSAQAVAAYTNLTGASAGGTATGTSSNLPGTNSGGSGSPGSILDLLTSPVETLGGWLASIALTLVKETAIGIGDTIIVPFWHWNQRAVMAYYLEMFGPQAWPMIPWNAVFWGLGYWLLFTDPDSDSYGIAPVRRSRTSHHIRKLQSVPARRELVKPGDIQKKTPKKPKPVRSAVKVNHVRSLKTVRPQTVRVTEGNVDERSNFGNIKNEAPDRQTRGRPRKAARRAPTSANKANRTGHNPLPDSSGVTRGSTETSKPGRRKPGRRRVSK